MKILDENGRIGGKISIVDVIVILLCLLMVLAVFVKFSDQDTRAKNIEAKDITYTVSIERIRQGTVDSFRKGDIFFENASKEEFGKAVKVEVKPATSLMEMNDGSMIEAPIEDRYDVILTLKTKAELNKGHVYINHINELNVNSSISLLSKYVQFTGTITGINK